MSGAAKRLMLVQFAGDYREAWRRRQAGDGETYYGHGYVLDQLRRFAGEADAVAMLCALSPEAYVEQLPDRVTLMAAAVNPRWHARRLLATIAAWRPTHLVVLGPMPPVIRWALRGRLRTLCLFADSFNRGALRRVLRYGRLGALLSAPGIDWVANHGRNACASLAAIGVPRERIVPWDWPQRRAPDEVPPRDPPGDAEPTLLFVGLVHHAKGIGDAIDALAILRRRGRPMRLKVAGAGDVERFRARAARRGVGDRVEFLGLVPNDRVFAMMRRADAVLVPSRPAYPEGLPLTIYEALCARTPIVSSDHPMFAGHLVDRDSAMVFRAGDPRDFADAIQRVTDDPAAYRALSARSAATWRAMQQPVRWGDLIHRWLADTPEDRAWIAAHTLASNA